MKNIYLIGFMGTGKSTVAGVLGTKLGTKCVEMDERIEERQQMTITELFHVYGEEYFRDLETELLHTFADEEGLVVSCGGGSVLREENASVMKQSGSIILLTASPETVYERVRCSTNRPVLNGHMNVADIRKLMEKRSARYEAVADIRVATDGKSAEEICREILIRLSELGEARRDRYEL